MGIWWLSKGSLIWGFGGEVKAPCYGDLVVK